jgi:hypothetical protein
MTIAERASLFGHVDHDVKSEYPDRGLRLYELLLKIFLLYSDETEAFVNNDFLF